MLNTKQWQYFNLNKLFKINTGIYHYSDEQEKVKNHDSIVDSLETINSIENINKKKHYQKKILFFLFYLYKKRNL